MGELAERVKINLLVNGNGIPDNFKNNSLYFYNKYQESTKEVLGVSVTDIQPGGFYHLHYLDTSSWMQFSPVFVADYKKFSNKIVIFAINFNFIPIEVRTLLFDNYVSEQDFENDVLLKVDYKGVYDKLRDLGFEYAMVEYDASRVKLVHKIELDLLPRFLYSQHPKNVYDPKKLIQIWDAKIANRDERHKEMMMASIDEFFDINNDISEKYGVLRNHVARIRNNMKKYGPGGSNTWT
jgi:hypothetical protein